jgi:purine nucleosidase
MATHSKSAAPAQVASAPLELHHEMDEDDMEVIVQGSQLKYHRSALAAALLTILAGVVMLLSSVLDVPLSFRVVNSAPVPSPPLPEAPPPAAPEHLQLIIDTDMAFDVDDVGAVCVAHALADLGEVDILAVVHDAGLLEGIGAVGAINTFYGRPEIQLGAFKGRFGANVAGPYVRDLASHFPSPVSNYTQVPACGEAYRRALNKAPDGSVVIAAIGFLVCLRDLLKSSSDRHSPYSGRDLVARKVKKVVFQGGWYEPLHPDGHDTFNWNCGRGWGFNPLEDDCSQSAQYVLAQMPHNVEMIYSDIGDEVLHGGKLTTCSTLANPCRQAYIDYLGPGGNRQSWDPVVVVLAVRGAEGMFGSLADVGWRNTANAQGANFWSLPATKEGEELSRQAQFTLNGNYPIGWAQPRAAASAALDELLCKAPAQSVL